MAEETGEELFVFNGIDAARGGYLLRPMSAEKVIGLANGEQPDSDARQEAVALHEAKKLDHFAPKDEVDPKDLGQAGWAVIFAHDEDPAVREALKPLLDLRREQASRLNEKRYRELSGTTGGYRPGEKKPKFLLRQGAPSSGPADPDRMPYYLLVVGDPEKIPFDFQAQLDLQYAVGRLHFDTLDEYAAYARSVVAAERGEIRLPRTLGLFGVKNPDDQATNLSEEGLIRGLEKYARNLFPQWKLDVRTADQAKKADLARVLGGADTPAVLFTASHGAGFPNGDPRQRSHQGALVTQDWGGPRNHPGPLSEDMMFGAHDLGDAARLAGLIAFHFACYGGGTPKYDAFFHRTGGEAKPIAPRSFVAAMPQRMLGHPRGGALAAVAHVERAWGCSFYSSRVGHGIAVFESFLKRLLEGHPIGSALDYFGTRYGELSSDLAVLLEELHYGNKTVPPADVANMWTANNDARNYTILGDPAVRVQVADDAAPGPRPTIEISTKSDVPQASPAQPAPKDTQTVTPAADAPALDRPEGPVAFGVFEDSPLKAIKIKLAAGMQGLADKLAKRLHAAVDDTTALEVSTFVAPDMSGVTFDPQTHRFTGAQLRAFTRIGFGGDTQQALPSGQGELDGQLWQAHQDAVAAAREHRSAMVKSGLEAIAGLFTAIKDL
jgi:hypothetical protein